MHNSRDKILITHRSYSPSKSRTRKTSGSSTDSAASNKTSEASFRNSAPVSTQPTKGNSAKSPASRAKAAGGLPVMGLKANWKSVVAARRSLTPASTTSTHSASPAPVASSRSTTPTPKASGTANRTATLKRVQRRASPEPIGGLNDIDVTVGVGSAGGKRPRYGQMAEVQESKLLDDIQPATPAKKRCAPRSLVPEEKSLSVQSLPEFIKPYWKATFV